jgi:DNA-binding NtrC family response regulator
MEFLRRHARQNGKNVQGLTDSAVALLGAYRWPGNVRELENVILQAVVLARQPLLDLGDLPRRISEAAGADLAASRRLADQLEQPEKQIVIDALRQHAGNIKRTAEMLEVSRTTLYAKLKKYNIDPEGLR